MDMNQFRQLLDKQHTWPCIYRFKFVVPVEQEAAVRLLLPSAEVSIRLSKNGRYVSVTLAAMMEDADAVIKVHTRAATIDGLLSL